jgi:hypothetical protein
MLKSPKTPADNARFETTAYLVSNSQLKSFRMQLAICSHSATAGNKAVS